MPPPGAKIFGIGLSKTGTFSLTVALQYLGYSAVHYPTGHKQIARNEAATDITVAAYYKQLDVQYPGSKFILTTRARADWLNSCERHYLKRRGVQSPAALEINEILYGTPGFDRTQFSAAYDRHDADVRRHFANRPDDLMTMDICGGAPSWEPLCRFLGKPVPDTDFPWANRTAVTEQILRRLLHAVGDAETTARIAGVYQGYVETLSRQASSDSPDSPLDWDGAGHNDEIVARACLHFGGSTATAAKLGTTAATVDAALARVAADRRRYR